MRLLVLFCVLFFYVNVIFQKLHNFAYCIGHIFDKVYVKI